MILIRFAQDQWFQLNNEWKKLYWEDEDREQALVVEGKKQEIRKIVDNSICECSRCSAPDKNMTYNPIRKEWYCVDCYKELQEYYKDKKESILFP